MDGVARWFWSAQGVEIKARHIHVDSFGGGIKRIKPEQNAVLQLSVDLGTRALGPQL
jgi:hypothetical protein